MELDQNVEHPFNELLKLASEWSIDIDSEEFALRLDSCEKWPTHRDKFEYPKIKTLPKGE